ncbi:MAG: hypothetical protein M3291_03215 [Actinomycetota bacterium]|nr:hypothetical protein [Actinomycetota bacterium]
MTSQLVDLTSGLLVLLTVALAGPLAVAGGAKLVTAPARLSWPFDTGPLRTPHGPRLVGSAELAAALAIVVLPGRAAALVALAAYAALTAVAFAMRGQKCACFGAARLANVGRSHVGANAGATLLATVLVVAGPAEAGVLVRSTVGLLAALATLVAVFLIDRRRRDAQESAAPCEERVSGVQLYVSDNCPACRSLKQLLGSLEPARRDAIRTTVVGSDQELPASLSGLGVPCAIPLDATGHPVCRPASGIGGVKTLINTITGTAPAVARGG